MDGNEEQVPLKVAFYIRVSTEEQDKQFGPDIQRNALDALIKSKGKLKDGIRDSLVFAGEDHVYYDKGIPGTTDLNERPAFAQLKEDYQLAEVGQKPFDVVAVFKIDRFARKLSILMDVTRYFEKRGITFISATESIDTSTPFGRAMIGIMGVLAELDRENINDRTNKGRREAIEQGVVMGAGAKFGYKKGNKTTLVIFPEEEKIVLRIFREFNINGMTPQQIANGLQKDEILSPDASAVHYGKRKGEVKKKNDLYFWRMEAVRAILSDDVYIGVRYKTKSKNKKVLPKEEWEKLPFSHEPIIDEPTFAFTQRKLAELAARRVIKKPVADSRLYLLRGLLKCEHCRNLDPSGDPIEATWTGSRKLIGASKNVSYTYQCNRKNRNKYPVVCPVIPIPAIEIENYVIQFVRQLLSNPQATYEYQKNLNSSRLNIKHLKEERLEHWEMLKKIPIRKERILEQHEAGAFDKVLLKEKIDNLKKAEAYHREKIDEIERQLSKETLSEGYKATFEEYAKKYGKATDEAFEDKEEVFTLLHMLIDQIVVYARPKTDSDRIAGVKKADQLIPNKIDIQFKLPQTLITELVSQGFVVRNDNL